ncbi:unnamed protein product [Prorocentrum cordatum]|uniref:Uncharacterized protein n=1 Tax=Prorocentrum cordatum TaxID=2364126 RepID=A0ABN9WWQ4_9DINO|nr:unnamed protein product [Polarella glacialis]
MGKQQPGAQQNKRGKPAASPSSSLMAPSAAPPVELPEPVTPRPASKDRAAQSVAKTEALVFSRPKKSGPTKEDRPRVELTAFTDSNKRAHIWTTAKPDEFAAMERLYVAMQKKPMTKAQALQLRDSFLGKAGAALKRPAAAATDPSDRADAKKEMWQIAAAGSAAAKTAPATFEESEEAALAIRKEGEPDQRQTSLAQRHVFKSSRESIDPEDLKKYDWYKSTACNIKGKERLANEIINAYVPRDAGYGSTIEPDQRALTRVNTREHKNIMIATVFNGSRAAFEEAKDDGDVWADPEDDTRYQYDQKIKNNTDTRSEKKTATVVLNPKDKKEFMGAIANMMEDMERPEWMNLEVKNKKERKAIKDDCADDTDMMLLQNCNDSFTSVTLDLQRMAPQVCRITTTEVIRRIAQESLDLLKKAAGPSEKIQKLLMTDPNSVRKLEAEDALIAAGKIYEQLAELHTQLRAIVNNDKKKQKASLKAK